MLRLLSISSACSSFSTYEMSDSVLSMFYVFVDVSFYVILTLGWHAKIIKIDRRRLAALSFALEIYVYICGYILCILMSIF